jgi:hypothetical protein
MSCTVNGTYAELSLSSLYHIGRWSCCSHSVISKISGLVTYFVMSCCCASDGRTDTQAGILLWYVNTLITPPSVQTARRFCLHLEMSSLLSCKVNWNWHRTAAVCIALVLAGISLKDELRDLPWRTFNKLIINV